MTSSDTLNGAFVECEVRLDDGSVGIREWFGFGRRDAVQDGILSPWSTSHLEAVTWAHLLDMPEDSRPITRADAMAIPAVARGRSLICGQAARLALTAVGAQGPLSPQPSIIAQPERFRARALTMSWAVDAMLFHGRAWLLITERYADGGKPRRLAWAPEHAVGWNPNTGRFTAWGQDVPLDDVIRVDGPHEGVLNYGRAPLRAARALSRAAARAAANPVPSIDLHQTGGDKLSQQEIDSLIDRWMRARSGRNGGVAFTSPTVEAKPLGQAVEQLLIQGRQQAEKECAQLLNLPAWAVDAAVAGSSLTYSNVPSRSRELLDYTLQPYMDAICGRLSLDDVLPHGTWAIADPGALLATDFQTRMNGYQAAITAGIYTAEECRALERAQATSNAAELDPAPVPGDRQCLTPTTA